MCGNELMTIGLWDTGTCGLILCACIIFCRDFLEHGSIWCLPCQLERQLNLPVMGEISERDLPKRNTMHQYVSKAITIRSSGSIKYIKKCLSSRAT